MLSGGRFALVITFQLDAEDMLTATVRVETTQAHPDLLDEIGRRCVRLFIEGNASLPEGAAEDDSA